MPCGATSGWKRTPCHFDSIEIVFSLRRNVFFVICPMRLFIHLSAMTISSEWHEVTVARKYTSFECMTKLFASMPTYRLCRLVVLGKGFFFCTLSYKVNRIMILTFLYRFFDVLQSFIIFYSSECDRFHPILLFIEQTRRKNSIWIFLYNFFFRFRIVIDWCV